MSQKGILSRFVRFIREGSKTFGAKASGKVLRARSYPLFGIPSGLTSGLHGDEGTKETLYPKSPLAFNHVPKTVDPELYWQFKAMLSGMELPEYGILTLQNATATSLGGNLSQKGELVTTFLQAIDGKPPHRHDLFRFSTKRFFPRIHHIQKPLITIAAGWQGAFYHWVFEVLPRLHLVEKAGCPLDALYVESVFAFQQQSLELLGITANQVIDAKEYAAVTTPRLIIPSIPETPTPWACDFLRAKILPKLSKRPSLKLYISRHDATRRRILNEEALFGVLAKKGFQKVLLSKLSFQEQAELFASAEVVVGPHGAGFSHLVFCPPNTPILEIFSPGYVNPCYWHVCDRVALDYHYLFGEGNQFTSEDPDIEVDIEKLQNILTVMGVC